jgi:hypothetical protein
VGISEDVDSSAAISTRGTRPALLQKAALNRFRRLLSQSWSPETAYTGSVNRLRWTPGNPRGQCGVSSVWLAEVLRREYSMRPTFCRGSLIFHYRRAENLLDHCWLEIGESGDELILDLTCDQARGFHTPIVFDSRADLDREHIHYISRERVDISNLPNNPVWPRYQMLLLNLRQLASANHALQEGVDSSHPFGDETLRLARAL